MTGANGLIAVTGATGHLGANLCPLLIERGYRVRALHSQPTSAKALHGLDLELRRGDINDEAFLTQALKGADGVVHLAAKISIEGDKDGSLTKINVKGTELVARLCLSLGINKMVHISSVHMFDLYRNDGILNELSSRAGEDAFAYDLSKRRGVDKVCQAMDEGLDGVILCPVGLLGPRDYAPSLMGHFLVNLYKGRIPALINGGFYWSDVRDTAQAIIHGLENQTPQRLYLLGGKYEEVKQLVALAAETTGRNLTRLSLPYGVALVGLPFLKAYSLLAAKAPIYTYESLKVLRSKPKGLDDGKARKDLVYQNRPLSDTIKDSYDWYGKQGLLS